MMFILLILIIVLVYYGSVNGNSSIFDKRSNDPEAILKERFVRGEIDEEKYLQMKETLKR